MTIRYLLVHKNFLCPIILNKIKNQVPYGKNNPIVQRNDLTYLFCSQFLLSCTYIVNTFPLLPLLLSSPTSVLPQIFSHFLPLQKSTTSRKGQIGKIKTQEIKRKGLISRLDKATKQKEESQQNVYIYFTNKNNHIKTHSQEKKKRTTNEKEMQTE